MTWTGPLLNYGYWYWRWFDVMTAWCWFDGCQCQIGIIVFILIKHHAKILLHELYDMHGWVYGYAFFCTDFCNFGSFFPINRRVLWKVASFFSLLSDPQQLTLSDSPILKIFPSSKFEISSEEVSLFNYSDLWPYNFDIISWSGNKKKGINIYYFSFGLTFPSPSKYFLVYSLVLVFYDHL